MEPTAKTWILGQAFKVCEALEDAERNLLLLIEFWRPKSLEFTLISMEIGHITSF